LTLPSAFSNFFTQRSSQPGSHKATPALPFTVAKHTAAFPSHLTQPLPLPVDAKQTQSEQFFLSATNVDIRALTIAKGLEFYIFMDLRAEYKWVTYSMTTTKWVHATNEFNSRLRKSGIQDVILKSPRAVMDKLAEIEDVIADRILKNNYLCT